MTIHTPTIEETWATQVQQLDIKKMLAEGAHALHVDITAAFAEKGNGGEGELPGPGANASVDYINSVTPYFGQRSIAVLDQHQPEGNAFFASTFQKLGIDKVAYSPDADPADYTITLEEFQAYRRQGIQFPFDADRFERYLDAMGGKDTLWPDHAIEGTLGGSIHPRIQDPPSIIVPKGTTRESHPYGSIVPGFEDSGLIDRMREEHVPHVFADGWLEDFCLGTVLLESAEAGFETYYFMDGTASLDIPVNETETTLSQMREKLHAAGVVGMTTAQFLEQVRSNS